MAGLEVQWPDRSVVLLGLCSGTDNAVHLAIVYQQVVEMVLLDLICAKDFGFRLRRVVFKLRRKIRLKRVANKFSVQRPEDTDLDASTKMQAFWELPTPDQLLRFFEEINARSGKALCIFSVASIEYYNRQWQLGRVLGLPDFNNYVTEIFQPQVRHTYPLPLHRDGRI